MESAPLPNPWYGFVSLLIDPDVVDVAFAGSVKLPCPPPGSGNAVVPEGAVGTAADDPSTEVTLALVDGKADKSVVVAEMDIDDAIAVDVEVEDEVTLTATGELPLASPLSELRAELA